jgi:hypothetical protein
MERVRNNLIFLDFDANGCPLHLYPFGEGADLPLKKPKRPGNRLPQKHKALCKDPDPDVLARAAAAVKYEPSPYHCFGPKGEKPKRRSRPASICPRRWAAAEAVSALRRAINLGYISEKTNGDFPRYIWYREGEDTIYEARADLHTPERFHAYPVESFQVPKELQW